ncbi:oligosaccharide flippase family protein [Fictibacillus phosphorivorans]|uniref:oligosaccharide flippase family protein n=1 Tax=Fictibacillus phosphorivorans TaxID=1221500 RepID=UPI00203ED6AA|nr:oligosaccharide flippase family protein [Fictibacillus phosphorivorans]MCM3717690.1 oligosaccharide flippase family protein [Fictibacillus phosphorivorans]MCM3775590.1 oligosaccharide flippase family protein [Fictibacillus phosphorivorans]
MKEWRPNSISKNIFHLFYSTAAASFINALVLIYLASYLEAYHYGMFSVALASAMIMGYFTDAGLTEIAIREGSKKDADVTAVLSSYIKVRALLLLITLIGGSCFISFFYSNNQELINVAYFLSIPMVVGLALQGVGTMFFQLVRKMQYIGIIKMFSAVMLICTLLLSILFSLSPIIVCLMYGISYCIAGVFAIILVVSQIPIRLNVPFLPGFLKHFTSFMFSGLLFIITPQLGPIVLEKTLTLKEVGLFAVAYRIPQALQQLPLMIAGAYRPVMFSRYHNDQMADYSSLHVMLIKSMALFGMVIAVPIFYLSDEFILLLFGESWLPASQALSLLALFVVFQAIGIGLADGLTTRGMQRYRTGVQLFAVVAGVLLYVLGSWKYGVIGGAYAGLAVEIIALFGFWFFLPNRKQLAQKTLLPYLLYFGLFLSIGTTAFSGYPFIGAIVHLVGMLLLVYLDKEMREKVAGLLHGVNARLKVKERVGNAIHK